MSRSLRYTFILVLVSLGAGLAALSGWRYARASAPVNGPIVVVSIDSLRTDHLPTYGYRGGATPAIDGLVKDGIVFERAYSHVPQTLPAHATLLSGRLPFEHGVRDGAGFIVDGNERMLAEMLRDRGYATAGVVSSFLLRKETGIGQGFALFDAATVTTPNVAPALERDGAESERIAERWFDSANTTRAFLFLHLAEPAKPVTGTDGIVSSDEYDAAVSTADDVVGRLIRYLKAHQLYDQSTIILLSDHGQGLGDHGEAAHGLLLYEEALRVPLVVKQAGGSSPGLRVATPVQLIDVVPTILDLAKAPNPGNLRGRSLVPLFTAGARFDDRIVYSESLFGHYHFGWTPLMSVTDGRYRLIRGATIELFDLDTDSQSRQNIATASPHIVTRLENALNSLAAAAPVTPMTAVAPIDRDRLERLGYVGENGAGGTTAVDIPPDLAIVERYRAAVRLLAMDDLTNAIEAFQALTAMQPMSADTWRHLANAATRAERHDLASVAYQRIVDLVPESPEGYLGAADALLRLRKYADARTHAQAVVDRMMGGAPEQAAAHERLSRVALGRRNYELARAEAEQAELLDPSRPVSGYVAGRIATDQRRHADALAAFEGALAKVEGGASAPIADLRIWTAESLLRAERPSEAEYLFLEQLKETPLNPRTIAGLTAIYKASGRTDEAAQLAAH